MLQRKKILLISPRFFNYEVEMKAKLEQLGAEVDLYDERPSNNTFTKALIRVRKSILYVSIRKHYQKILDEVGQRRYDYFLLIKGESTPSFFLEKMRKIMPDTKFVYYTYDSVVNNSNAIRNFPYFDRAFSFDEDDIPQFDQLRFRPLFYIDQYAMPQSGALKYDFSFVGTAHSDRYTIMQKVLSSARKNVGHNLSVYLFFYIQSNWYYLFRKLTDPHFREVRKSDLSFKPMTQPEIFRIFCESKCIIDIHHKQQTGITMRTIEALGAGKKIITTNHRIRGYDFYTPENVLVIDRNDPDIPAAFLDQPYKQPPAEIFEKYSIEGFLLEILDIKIMPAS